MPYIQAGFIHSHSWGFKLKYAHMHAQNEFPRRQSRIHNVHDVPCSSFISQGRENVRHIEKNGINKPITKERGKRK